jgi:cytochrome oxidase Cu insertion factor (SCO1/SenC/PrrC family)
MSRWTIVFLGALLLVSGAGMICLGLRGSQPDTADSTTEIDKEFGGKRVIGSKITEFTLTDQEGKPFSSKQLAGKVWVANFFFASCRTTCTEQNRRIRILQSDYAKQGLEAVSITCDPSRDTPSALATYSKQFNADPRTWHFLTWHDFGYIQRIANDYFSLPLERMTHSDQVVLVRQDGTVHDIYSLTTPAGFVKLIDNIKMLLESDKNASSPAVDASARLRPAATIERSGNAQGFWLAGLSSR